MTANLCVPFTFQGNQGGVEFISAPLAELLEAEMAAVQSSE
jgi:hypothetical protein